MVIDNFLLYKTGKPKINETDFEIVERKGIGHPDNICDSVAEKISIAYSKYCIKKYGVILRHMVDKITILGGSSFVTFGDGEMKKPIRLLLNGRFTYKYENDEIPYLEIAEKTIKEYFSSVFPLMDVNKWLLIIDNTHFSQGPGVVYDKSGISKNERSNFFSVKNSNLANLHNNTFRSNDTSTTVSYSPLSDLEKIVILTESTLNGEEFKKKNNFVGTDIKVMGKRQKNKIELTICIPFIAKYTPSLDFYIEKLNYLNQYIKDLVLHKFGDYTLKIFLNTRDNFDNQDVYLTAIGSAIESGDEGAVGRGNRSNGVIPFTRNMSSEAPCGKNPVYHTGKIFTVIGNIISDRIYEELKLENTVYLTSQMGGLMTKPWQVAVGLDGFDSKIDDNIKNNIEIIIEEELQKHNETTNKIIEGLEKVY